MDADLPENSPKLTLMKWDDYKAEFEWDGSWRDIYVLATSLSDWQALLTFLKSGAYEYSYFVDSEPIQLPSDVKEVFATWESASPLLGVQLGSVILNCHFFLHEEIEFDLDPREILSEEQAEQVFDFMGRLGRLLNKEVLLTPENLQSAPIFEFSPHLNQLQHFPA